MRSTNLFVQLITLFSIVWVSACTAGGEIIIPDPPPTPANCTLAPNGVVPLPTEAAVTDPNLSIPRTPTPSNPPPTPLPYCTPQPPDNPPPPTETPVPPEQFLASDVSNLSLSPDDENVVTSAMGDDILAIAWIKNGGLYVSITQGGTYLQGRFIDNADNASMVFSPINRLHLAYEREGNIYYRTADQGEHPASSPSSFITAGSNPQVVLDQGYWAHIIYEGNTFPFFGLTHMVHQYGEQWDELGPSFGLSDGSNPTVIRFQDDPTTNWYDGGFVMTSIDDSGAVRVSKFWSPFGLQQFWEHVATFNVATDEDLLGSIGVDFYSTKITEEDSDGEDWLVATWITKREDPAPLPPNYVPPLFEAVNPLAPLQIANPSQIVAGFQAARWYTTDDPHDGGLMQTVNVTDTNGTLTLEAQGLAEGGAASFQMMIGIDPTGGTDALSPHVVWSTPANPQGGFTQFSVSASAEQSTATIFLRSILDTSESGTAVWDNITLSNGSLVNGDFEDGVMAVPHGWSSYFRDGANQAIEGRDIYTLYAAWSDDGGFTWSGPEIITENKETAAGITGALRGSVFPFISFETDPPSMSFFYIYESGDPPANTDFQRYGRPTIVLCELGTSDTCSDSPGDPLLSRQLARPTFNLSLAIDNTTLPARDRGVLVWDSLQSDDENKDVYSTLVVLR